MHEGDIVGVVKEFKEEAEAGALGEFLTDPQCCKGQFPSFVRKPPFALSLVTQGCLEKANNILPDSLVLLNIIQVKLGRGASAAQFGLFAFLAFYSSPSAVNLNPWVEKVRARLDDITGDVTELGGKL